MKKTYKVVCTKPELSDDIYIDIAPSEGIIHEQIYFSRMQLHRQQNSAPLKRFGGQIYLHDNDGNITIEFPNADKEIKDRYDDSAYAKLEERILRRYQQMRLACLDSTLFVYNIDEMFDIIERKKDIAESVSYKEKHRQQLYPQSPQEERLLQQADEFIAIQEHRIIAEQKRAEETIPAWLRFQKQYSGD